ncbi:hypothetical protein T492DRAFT_524029 [Pavlovales sp. CCMP2436]|nr:hypothetical protein T492DRAFT_524029 [Pavlovales sp. CCMP2436]
MTPPCPISRPSPRSCPPSGCTCVHAGFEPPHDMRAPEDSAIEFLTLTYGAGYLKHDEATSMSVADLGSSELRPVRKGFRQVGGALYLSPDLKRVVNIVAFGTTHLPADKTFAGALCVFSTALLRLRARGRVARGCRLAAAHEGEPPRNPLHILPHVQIGGDAVPRRPLKTVPILPAAV